MTNCDKFCRIYVVQQNFDVLQLFSFEFTFSLFFFFFFVSEQRENKLTEDRQQIFKEFWTQCSSV